MKRILISIFLIVISFNIFAQFQEEQILSKHYKVYYQSNKENALNVANKVDALFAEYNNYFRFDTTNLQTLNIKLFDNYDGYKDYVSNLIDNPVSPFIYIQYKDPARCELVGYFTDNKVFDETLIHYTFIQFIRTFINNPPQWLEKGFAIYFEKSQYNTEKNEILYKENLTWLNTLKEYIENENKGLIELNNFFKMTKEDLGDNSDIFYAQSWGLINFLLNSQNPVYSRVIWDAINKMTKESSREENEIAVVKAFSWLKSDKLSKDFYEFVTALKTFPQLVESGIKLYDSKKYTEAKINFIKAISIDDKNYVPYYYLGLIHYNQEDYAMADFYYNSALQIKCDRSICYYALAINAFAKQDYENAIKYLKTVLSIDPTYKTKVDKILEIITNTLKLQNIKIDFDSIKPIKIEQVKTEPVKTKTVTTTTTTTTTIVKEEKKPTEVIQVEAVDPASFENEIVTSVEKEIELTEEDIAKIEKSSEEEKLNKLKLDKVTGEYIPVN